MRHPYFNGVLQRFGIWIAEPLFARMSVRNVTLMVPILMVLGAVIAVGVLTSGSSSLWLLITLLVWQIALIFDCVDGYMARLRGQASMQGAALDATADTIGIGAVGISLGAAWLSFGESGNSTWVSDLHVGALILATLFGVVLWTTAPLSTVAKSAYQADRSPDDRFAGHSESLSAKFVASFIDWALIVLVISVALVSSSSVLLVVSTLWLVSSGVAMGLTRFCRFYK